MERTKKLAVHDLYRETLANMSGIPWVTLAERGMKTVDLEAYAEETFGIDCYGVRLACEEEVGS